MKRRREKSSGQVAVTPARDTGNIYRATTIGGSVDTFIDLKQMVRNFFYISSCTNQPWNEMSSARSQSKSPGSTLERSYPRTVLLFNGPTLQRSYPSTVLSLNGPTLQRSYPPMVLPRKELTLTCQVTTNCRYKVGVVERLAGVPHNHTTKGRKLLAELNNLP